MKLAIAVVPPLMSASPSTEPDGRLTSCHLNRSASPSGSLLPLPSSFTEPNRPRLRLLVASASGAWFLPQGFLLPKLAPPKETAPKLPPPRRWATSPTKATVSAPSQRLVGKKRRPVSDYFATQGRFKSLDAELVQKIQEQVDAKWAA